MFISFKVMNISPFCCFPFEKILPRFSGAEVYKSLRAFRMHKALCNKAHGKFIILARKQGPVLYGLCPVRDQTTYLTKIAVIWLF